MPDHLENTAVLRDGRFPDAAPPPGTRLDEGLQRVVLFDTQALVRQALRSALESCGGFRIVGEARDAADAAGLAAALRPDIVLVHAVLDPGELLETVELIRDRAPDTRVIVIGADDDIGVLIAALDVGASGFFTKASSFAEFVEAAGKARPGQVLLPRAMLEELLSRLLERRSEELQALQRLSRLTGREREVLSMLADGADNSRIGRALVISPQTARTHVQNILSKLGLHSRLEAVAFVRRLGRYAELLRPTG